MGEADTVAYNTLAEKYLKKFGTFLEGHSIKLVHLLQNETYCEISEAPEKDKGPFLYSAAHHIWDQKDHPISLSWINPLLESTGLEELVFVPLPPVGNPDIQKVLLVLVNLTNELKNLREEALSQLIPPLLLYGESFEGDLSFQSSSISEGEGHVVLSKFLPFLYELQNFLTSATELCIHWMTQLGALYKDSKPHVVSITSLHLNTVFREFADFLALLVILDEIIRNQSTLQEHWLKYRQMIKSVQADCLSFESDAEKLSKLERELFFLEKEVISAHIFDNFLIKINQQVMKAYGNGKPVNLSEEFQFQVNHLSITLDKEFLDGQDEFKPIAVAALYVFASSMFSSSCDWRKLFNRSVFEPLKKIPAVSIGSSYLWIPEHFLNSFSLKPLDNRSALSYETNRQSYLKQKVASLPKDIVNYSMQIGSWSVKLQEIFYSKLLNQLELGDLSKRCNLLLQGVKHAQILSQNFRLIMNLHISLNKPVTKPVVCLLCQLLELFKQVQSTFYRFSVQICNSSLYIVQHVMHMALSHVKIIQKKLSFAPKLDELRSDSLTVLKILESALRGPSTPKRLLVAKISLDWAVSSSRLWKDESSFLILPAALERITFLVNMVQRVEEVSDGSWIFWHRIVLPTYFSTVNKDEIESVKLSLMSMVLQDCSGLLNKSPHREQAVRSFISETEGYIKYSLVDKMCQDIETDLRLLAHSHLQVQSGDLTSPFRVGVKDFKYFLETSPFTFDFQRSFALRLTGEYYLSKTFYNLASVALHDWQSYTTMRVLAWDKYGFEVVDDHLPGHSLEQGRDILEIVRNLSKFVQEFTYNLNNQVFIQVNSPNKHLDTVNIRHLANSMRAHGPGLANTTVNSTYQFLRPKMHIFSQFLYEEQIRSRLAKDLRQLKLKRQEEPSNFPFKVAEKLKKGIRKLGVQDGLTRLDLLRILITHIGNALGFVRLVKSGGSHFLAGGCQFVPDLEDVTLFGEMPVHEERSEWKKEVEEAAVSVDSSLKTLTSSFSGGVDYFKLLVGAFSSACQDPRNSHLKYFYAITPALTLSYVDHMRLCKEKLAKKSKSASIFTEDGFPMGLAYLLKVLGQDKEFDSLGWFASVQEHYMEEKRREMQMLNEARNDEKLEQASKLTAKRFQDYLQEFQLLYYSLSSARIFFHTDNQN